MPPSSCPRNTHRCQWRRSRRCNSSGIPPLSPTKEQENGSSILRIDSGGREQVKMLARKVGGGGRESYRTPLNLHYSCGLSIRLPNLGWLLGISRIACFSRDACFLSLGGAAWPHPGMPLGDRQTPNPSFSPPPPQINPTC